jgi:hypothetical protein
MLGMRNPLRRRQTNVILAVEPTLIYFVDVYWCDAAGTYLQGWAIVQDTPLAELRVRIGTREAIAKRSARLDILPHYPAAVDAEHAGFSVYIPGRPGDEVLLVGLREDGREISTVLELPDHQLPVLPDLFHSSPLPAEFPGHAPPGPILAVGIRSATQEVLESRLAPLHGRDVVGFDIHPGIGVDVVGDAHRLSSYFPPNHFAGIYTVSLLEHLTTPWLFAAECAKVLMPKGRLLHQVPWAWPTHAQPNDFWRMSSEALEQLFGAELGFQTISSGAIGSATIVPMPRWREEFIMMPTTPSALGSWIHSEKVTDAARAVTWPYDAEAGAAAAIQYPVDGLAPPRVEI